MQRSALQDRPLDSRPAPYKTLPCPWVDAVQPCSESFLSFSSSASLLASFASSRFNLFPPSRAFSSIHQSRYRLSVASEKVATMSSNEALIFSIDVGATQSGPGLFSSSQL